MCDTCYGEAGSPTERTADTGRLVQAVRDLYAIHPTGGPLHVVLDDWNVDCEHVAPSYEHYDAADLDALYYQGWSLAELPPEAPAVTEGLGRSTRQLCDEIATLLTAMTMDQRYAALAYAHGLIDTPSNSG